MYHRAAPSLFKAALSQFRGEESPLVYGELFYAGLKEEQLGSFTYSYNPLNRAVRTHMTLWSGHEEAIVYRANAKCEVVEWRYTLVHHGHPVSWSCIHRSVKDALAAKSDDHIVLTKTSSTE